MRPCPKPPRSAPMNDATRSVTASLLAIVLAGGIAAVLAWWIVTALGIGGLAGALLTVFIAMVLALALFALGAILVKTFAGRT